MPETLELALLAALDERPDSASGFAVRLSVSGVAYSNTSSVNSVLYRLEREQRVRRIPASPPIWRLIREVDHAEPAAPTTTVLSTEPTTARAPAVRESVTVSQLTRSDPIIWKSATRHLAKGRPLHVNSLAALVRQDIGLSESTIKAKLHYGSDVVSVDGLYLDLKPEHRLMVTLESFLPAMVTTPDGNPRPGAVGFEAVGGSRKIVARFEVVDDEVPYWCCVRVRTAAGWSALRDGAETVGADWGLPWQVPSDRPDRLPGILVWRAGEVDGLVSAAQRVARALDMHGFAFVRLTAVPREMEPIRQFNIEQQTIERLVRRRGPVATGRKHPIRGSCDHCGQPLSDPYSLLVGVGPVCRGYYSPRVLSVVASTPLPVRLL